MVLLTSHKTDVYAKESGENESHTNGESRVGYWLHQHWCHAAKCLLLLLSDLDHLALPTEEKQFLYYTEDLSMVNITLIFHSFVTAPWPGLCRGRTGRGVVQDNSCLFLLSAFFASSQTGVTKNPVLHFTD